MRFEDDDDFGGRDGMSVNAIVLGVSLVLVVILAVVFLTNSGNTNRKRTPSPSPIPATEALEGSEEGEGGTSAEDLLQNSSGLRAEDLDFWDMYPAETEETVSPDQEFRDKQEEEKKKKQEEEEKRKLEEEENDPARDGKHTKVTLYNGEEKWLEISSSIPKNNLDDLGFQKENGLMRYYQNGKNVTVTGIDISQKTTGVSYGSLKNKKIDYAMVRLGGRGYDSGQISLDSRFKEHIEGLKEAGVPFGVYFYSQAINQQEASEEVNYIVQTLAENEAKPIYPIAIDMELPLNDSARIESVSGEDRMTVINTFCEGVKAAGYTPIIYGDKTWLLTEINLAAVSQYDIWLSQDGDLPDYPYNLAMWQYETEGKISGVTGEYGLSVSFIDYSAR